jgi:hypothetical protein
VASDGICSVGMSKGRSRSLFKSRSKYTPLQLLHAKSEGEIASPLSVRRRISVKSVVAQISQVSFDEGIYTV